MRIRRLKHAAYCALSGTYAQAPDFPVLATPREIVDGHAKLSKL